MTEYKVTKHRKKTKPMITSLIKSFVERSNLTVKEIAVCANTKHQTVSVTINRDKPKHRSCQDRRHDRRLSSALLSRPMSEWGDGYRAYKSI